MRRILPLLCIISIFASSYGQKEKYQSLFIYNFTKYIKWPESYNSEKFIIAVLGNSEVLESLNSMASAKKKTSSGQVIEIRKYNTLLDIGDCNILFVSENTSGDIRQIESNTSSKPILIITDTPGLATQGSIINFIETDGKIKFELNQSKASKRGLKVSASLTSLAILI